jgi:hypothetical protein
MDLTAHKEAADHEGDNRWNIRDTRGADRAEVGDDGILGEIALQLRDTAFGPHGADW